MTNIKLNNSHFKGYFTINNKPVDDMDDKEVDKVLNEAMDALKDKHGSKQLLKTIAKDFGMKTTDVDIYDNIVDNTTLFELDF